jgi:long-chain acyl-CoA synthetase
MREAHEPTLIAPITSGGLVEPVIENARDFPNTVVLIKRHGSTWLDVTAAAFLAEVQAVAKGLIAKGIEPGQRVGLMSRTRYEWTLADYAIWYAGAVTVPIYETSSAEQVQWILSDSDAVALFNESPLHGELLAEIRDTLPHVRQSWTFDEGAIRDLMAAGRAVTDEVLERRRQTVTPDSMATIIYTSGTTGRPKGCVLTHSNFMFECDNIVAALPELFLVGESSTLLFLPLAHVFGRAIQIGCVLLADLNTFKPTFVLSVPRVFEKVFNGASQKAQAEGKGAIFERAARVAQAYSQAQSSDGPSLILKLQHAVFDRLVYGKLRAAMGGNVAWAVSGGAPLGERLGHFFRGVGITILEGYGLTETSAASNLNRPSNIRVGTVGRPIPGSTIRIADDGEVLIKGAFVFTNYWKNEAGTREAIDGDGWFHSGDIGVLDEAGFLSITGRKKEIIVTAGGKNVAPAALEDRLRANWLVSQCIVVGDNQPFIGCLITLDPESLPAWLAQHGRDADTSLVDLSRDSELIADIQLAVDDANRSVSHAEAIKKFTILPVDWTEENGLLTPSLKLKRAEVLKQFNTAVDDLYS